MIFWELFYEFFLIGLFTFGGGYAMIPLVEQTVIGNGWLEADAFEQLIGVCESTPGPIAINMATYVGSVQGELNCGALGSVFGGMLGSISATLGVVLPSFIIIILIASVLKNFTENKYFKAFVTGVKPIIVALLISTGSIFLLGAIGLPLENLSEFKPNYISMIIFAILLGVYFTYGKIRKKKLSTIPIILTSAGLGIVVSVIFEMILK